MATVSDAFKALNAAIDNTPLIDNHCHNLLKPDHISKVPLLSIASEAQGNEALEASKTSLAHIRATKHLAQVLNCEQSWDAVESAVNAQRSRDLDAWHKRCYQGFETLLLDDGFGGDELIHPYSWHDSFVTSKCKRIVRIETLASGLFTEALSSRGSKSASAILEEVIKAFVDEISRSIADPDVVGFKSIICYRGGLDIPRDAAGVQEKSTLAFQSMIELFDKSIDPFKRPEQLPFNQSLVHLTARLISQSESKHKKGIQFHTGLGDNDIILTKSSPAHMQPFISQYPTVPIILLHSSYPWTREAGYLATMYPNVYADIGEVFPFLNQDGQEGILRQILELTPWSKVLMSTDGHSHPEMYLITLREIKSVMKTVIGGQLAKGQLNANQAIQLVQDILYNNSNKLYDLGLAPKTLATPLPVATSRDESDVANIQVQREADIRHLSSLNCKWLRVCWHDYTSSSKMRLLPMRRVLDILRRGQDVNFALTSATLGLLPTDMMIPSVGSSGTYFTHVDLSKAVLGPAPGHASVFCEIRNEDGSDLNLCPKTVLRHAIEKSKSHGLEFKMGFELELVIMERNPDQNSPEKYLTLRNDGHSWSMARAIADAGREGSFNSALDEILDNLTDAGIDIEGLHPENAPGQYEIILPPKPPMEACESLLTTRLIVEAVAARRGFRMTLIPKPFPFNCGTASHMHMSITSPGGDSKKVYEPFYAGIIKHFPALITLMYSNIASYERMVDSAWAGGRWVTWGTQNKEAPLRKCKDSHWEIKTIDGLANPYFVVAGILAAGTRGVVAGEKLVAKDFLGDPAKLSGSEREKLGITKMFPADLRVALEELEKDTELGDFLNRDFVRRYIDMKTAELEMLEPMEATERRQWLIARY
ncbi:glutamine synthetase [Pestalotiopsis sp. NC0098]|nr:glutamine synthetase [Pestalotiopsis sp. NC0098]